MTDLKCLLLTDDRHVLDVVQPALVSAGIVPQLSPNPTDALECLRTSHFDGVVIDYADASGSVDLIEAIRNGRSSRSSVILAIVDANTSPENALRRGANFVLQKPVSRERVESYLRIALVFLNREFRRYLRYAIELPVKVTADRNVVDATTINISEEGLGLKLPETAQLPAKVHLKFALPGRQGALIKVEGDVVWTRPGKAGIRFRNMSPESVEVFHTWFESLCARRNAASQS
jgi:ActR/RegA family two-component response regulator